MSRNSVTATSFSVDATIAPTTNPKIHSFKLEFIGGTGLHTEVNTQFLEHLHQSLKLYLGK
jgi:precorrin-6B methylase 2